MPSLSFKFKLLLGMMLVVSGITFATMYVGQRKLGELYEDLLEHQFRTEMQLFQQAQEARWGGLKEKSRSYVRSVRLIALLHEIAEETSLKENQPFSKTSPSTIELLYATADQELLLKGAPRWNTGFLRFFNAEGQILARPNRPDSFASHLEGKLAKVLPDLEQREEAIGYLVIHEGSGDSAMYEVLITRITDPENDDLIGALAIGFLCDPSEPARSNKIQSGIVVENHFHGTELPAEALLQLQKTIGQETSGEFKMMLNGSLFKVFHRDLTPNSPLPRAVQILLHSMEDGLAQQQELKSRVIAVGAGAMGVAMLLSLILTQGLSGPLEELVQGTQAIQKGNYEVKVQVRNRDEIGRLAESFNEMVQGLALKEKYRSVLDLVADKGIAEELMSGRIALGGEEKVVTVLFCDIRGFTALTEKMPPPEVIQMLNEHFTPLTRVVYAHGGVVDKFVGDLIMAIFGAPKSSGNDASNAVHCALAMLEERSKMNVHSKYQIKMGIGIATGPAVAGRMGSTDRLNYTVLGPKVNLAARLCSQAGPMEIVIDEKTMEAIQDWRSPEPIPEMKLKGFEQPVRAWKLSC